MLPEHEFDALLEADPADGGGVWVVAPADVSAAYQGRRFVQATLDGFPHQGRLADLGGGHYGLLVPKQLRRSIGKTIGDTVRVALAHDPEAHLLVVPADLTAALAEAPAAAAFFAQLSLSHRREYVRWIEESKRPDIRHRRLVHTLEALALGKRR